MSSYLKSPISQILANRSHVVLLRELFVRHPQSLTAGELEQKTNLSKQGIFNTIHALEQLGILQKNGRKGNFYYSIRKKNPFFPSLYQLFNFDKEFHDSLISEIRTVVENEPLISVYIGGSYALGEDLYSDLIELDLVSNQPFLNKIKQSVENQITKSLIQETFDVNFYVRVFSIDEYKQRHNPSRIIWGVDIKNESFSQPFHSHSDLEKKSDIMMDEFIVQLEKSPDLVEKTIQHIENKWDNFTPSVQKTYQIWLNILRNWPLVRLKTFLKTDSDLRSQLLQSNPFFLIQNK